MAESSSQRTAASPEPLPEELRPLFWDHAFDELDWASHRDFVIGRVLIHGSWSAVQWLRGRVGNDALRHWILHREGRGLSPQQLRFWELILKLPKQEVDRWLAERGPGWEDRVARNQ